MLRKNNLILLLITLSTLVLSGFFFYEGLKGEVLTNLPEEIKYSLPLPTPSQSLDILGQTASEPARLENEYPVTKVIDGDTIEVNISGERKTVRLIGIDTPETVDPRRPVGCFGKEASDETKRLLEGKSVILEKDISDTDRYNRLLRYVYLRLSDGSTLFVNDYLIRQGFANSLSYPPDVKYTNQFLEAQTQARENLRGLWSKCQN